MKIQDRVTEQATKLRESGSNEEKIECLEKLEKMFGDFGQKGSFVCLLKVSNGCLRRFCLTFLKENKQQL